MKTKQLFFLLLAFNLCMLATSPVKANGGNDHNNEQHEGTNNDHEGDDHESDNHEGDCGGTRAPIDGGISILLAAGIGYGVKRMMNKNKVKEENNQL